MVSGSLWLHPLHVPANDGTHPIQFSPISMKSRLTDVPALHAFVAELTTGSGSQFESRGEAAAQFSSAKWQVFLNRNGMIISSGNEAAEASQTMLQLSLCFCEVVHVKAGEQHLIAMGRRDRVSQEGQSKQGKRQSLDGPFGEVWVFILDGDENVLRHILSAMSSLGAIQEDFQNIYHLSDKPIGTGCCSAVYSGKLIQNDVNTKLPIAIADQTLYDNRPRSIAAKVFKRSSDKHVSEMATAEVALLSKVQRHPNIIGFYGLFTMPDLTADAPVNWVMVMEWCCRGDLHDYLQVTGPCKESRAAEILVGVLAALAHVHSHNIVHRDVKAENILLGEYGKPILSDFGIAAQLDDESAMKQRCGSPGYAAPEILSNKIYDEKIDIFSTGVVLYFILCGSLPFAGADVASVLRRTVRCRVKFPKVFDTISDTMKQVILKLLQPDSAHRPDATSACCITWKTWCRNREELPEWLCGREHEVLGKIAVQYPTNTRVEAEAADIIESAEEVVPRRPLAAVASSMVRSVDGISGPGETASARNNWMGSFEKARTTKDATDDKKEGQAYYSTNTDSTVATPRQAYYSNNSFDSAAATSRQGYYSSNDSAGASYQLNFSSFATQSTTSTAATRDTSEGCNVSFDTSQGKEEDPVLLERITEPVEVTNRLLRRALGLSPRSQSQTPIKKPTIGPAPVNRFFKRVRGPPSAGADEERLSWRTEGGRAMSSGTETLSGSSTSGCMEQVQPTPPPTPKITTNDRVQRYLFKRRDSGADSAFQRGRRVFKPLIVRRGDGTPGNASRGSSKEAAMSSEERSISKDLSTKDRMTFSKERISSSSRGWCTFSSGNSTEADLRSQSFSPEQFDDGTPRLSFGSGVNEEIFKEATLATAKHVSADFQTDVDSASRITWDRLPIQDA